MTRRNLSITIAIGFIALLGIIAVQLHWIRSAYFQNKIRFEQNLNKALNQIVFDLSRQENFFFESDTNQNLHYVKGASTVIRLNGGNKNRMQWQSDSEKVLVHTQFNKIDQKQQFKTTGQQMNRKIVIRSIDNNVNLVQELYLDSLSEKIAAQQELKASAIALLKKDSLLKKYEARVDSVRELLDYNVFTIASKTEDLNKTMVELFMNIKSATRPFSERIPMDKLKSIIDNAVVQYDLPEDYAYAIASSTEDSILFKTENFDISNLHQAYSIRLFPNDIVARPEHFYIIFPQANPLFNQMFWPISLAFIFTILLLASLLIIINNLLHHKKLSAIKTDFINNMTHEFKTPIATIQLASDAVMTDQVRQDTDKISYFMQMIKSENKRMNALVERILQMAQLEKKSFSLIKSEINMHALIEAVVENTKLKLDQAKGRIILKLEAEQNILSVDEVHMTNVLFNLIDNAIKYRSQELLIEISTSIRNKQFVIAIEDNGIGISKDSMTHIFDKFFRLSESNVHTVKGYGLGLSYVKAIIDKHHGQIHVSSELGVGSRFEISIPFKH